MLAGPAGSRREGHRRPNVGRTLATSAAASTGERQGNASLLRIETAMTVNLELLHRATSSTLKVCKISEISHGVSGRFSVGFRLTSLSVACMLHQDYVSR